METIEPDPPLHRMRQANIINYCYTKGNDQVWRDRAVCIIGLPVWNSPPEFFRSNDCTTTFKRRLKLHFSF